MEVLIHKIHFSQAGTYWLEVTDSVFGCTVSDTVVITENPQIIIDSVVTIQTTSCGAADGIIRNFCFRWNPSIQLFS